MPSVVHVSEVHTTVCKWGWAEGGGVIVDVIPPVITLTVGVYLVNRLDAQLRVQWLQHRQNIKTPTFQLFADWIKRWANISRMDKDINPHQASSNYAEATYKNIPKPFNNIPQQPQRPLQQRTSPGEREYRDLLRQRRNSNSSQSTPTRGRSPSPNPISNPRSRSPSPSKNANAHSPITPQNLSPKKDAIKNKCAWCTERGINHNHTTPNCAILKNANAMDQWKVLYKRKVCDRCLEFGHHWKECSTRNPRCPSCSIAHHHNISCRPTERISLYPREKASSSPDTQ